MPLSIPSVLAQSWRLCWRHRVLWVLGLLMVLPQACSMGLNLGERVGRREVLPRTDLLDRTGALGEGLRERLPTGASAYFDALIQELEAAARWLKAGAFGDGPGDLLGPLLMLGALFGLAALLVGLVAFIGRAALIRSVGEYGERLESLGLRQAIGLGWSLRSARLLLADLLVGLATLALVAPIVVLAVAFLIPARFASSSGFSDPAQVLILILIVLAVLLLAMLVAIPVGVLTQLATCEILVEDASIGSSFARGFDTLRHHFGDVARLTLVSIGLSVAIMTALAPLNLVLGLGQVALAAGLGAALKALLGGLLGAYPTLITLSMGSVLALGLIGLPWLVMMGLLQAFQLSVWTLAWRAWRDADRSTAPPLPESGIARLPVDDPV